MKSAFQKQKPNIVDYIVYKQLSNDELRKNLLLSYHWKILDNSLEQVFQISIETLDKCAPLKNKYTLGNNMTFMNRTLTNTHKNRAFFKKSLS